MAKKNAIIETDKAKAEISNNDYLGQLRAYLASLQMAELEDMVYKENLTIKGYAPAGRYVTVIFTNGAHKTFDRWE